MQDSNSQPAPNDQPILRSEHLGRRVGDKVLVEDVSFSLMLGEILAIVGPSGSGKSSLLRLLNRLDEPTAGTVYLEGIEYHTIPPRELRRKVGMMTQLAFLFPGTVGENIAFGPAQRGEQLPREQIEKLLADVGLPGYVDRDVSNLSGGEAQRVSLARSLANNPVVLLLDEPTSALDDTAKSAVEALILRIVRQSQLTCVIVTHDTQQARRFADRALLLEQGRMKQIGSAQEVLRAATPVP
jgi:ABC-type Fe3+/spermidine/putrescine transport system ATPase subunit